MLSKVFCISLNGVEGTLIKVEVDVNNGLPTWDIVGLPGATVRESKERVRSAIRNMGYELPSRKIVVNLAPANTKKEGAAYDLPIAIGILKCLGRIFNSKISEYIFIGELSLDGTINKVNGVLPMCIEAKRIGIKKIFVPYENRREAGVVDDVEIYPVRTLREVVECLNDGHKFESKREDRISQFISDVYNIDPQEDFDMDFSEVRGQENVKRALEIAAAGGHNCLLIGSPRFGENNAI